MNKREKKIVNECIDDLWREDGDFLTSMDKLMHLVGRCAPAVHEMKKMRTVDLKDVLKEVDWSNQKNKETKT